MTPALVIRVLIVAAGCAVAGAAARVEGRQVFTARSELVVLHVNVFEDRSDAVPNLPQSAFRVFEDGEPQTISFFSSIDVPVAVGLVIDNSSSMIARHGMVVAGSTAFAESSHPEDEMFTVLFNEEVRFGLPETMPFTTRRSFLLAGLARFTPGGKTALHDAVIAALEHLDHASHQKHVLVVLSDGEDNASRHSQDAMMALARESDAIIYTVSNADRRIGLGGDPEVLRDLADATGGVAYFPRDDEEVVARFNEIAGNIRRGYTIGYVPTNTARDGTFRRVKVTVEPPSDEFDDLTVRTRDGYTAPRATGSY